MDHSSTAVADNGKVGEQTSSKTGPDQAGGDSPTDVTGPATTRPIGSGETAAGPGGGSALEPLTPPQPRRRIDLTTAVLPEPGNLAAVESLTVRELKGPGQTFTANLEIGRAHV